MRGRKPKAGGLKIMRADRIKTPPVPPPGEVRCPSWLSKGDKAVWRRLGPLALAAGTLTTLDIETFARLCHEVGRYWRLAKVIEEEGETYKSGDLTKPHPSVGQMEAAAKEARLLGERFGLDPLSRQRLDKPKGNADDDELSTFMANAR